MFRLRFAIFLEVNNGEKAERLIDKIRKSIAAPVVVESSERYWKIKSQWKTVFVIELSAETQAQAVLDTLNICNKFSSSWQIAPPQTYESGVFEFTGTARSNFHFSGVVFVDFLIQ